MLQNVAASISVGLGGLLGAVARYWLNAFIASKASASFPLGTMLVNISGSLLIGLIMGLFWKQGWSEGSRLFLVVGVLGGYTTFSSFSLDAMNLISEKSYGYFALYVLGSVLLSLLATWIGLIAARAMAGG